MCKVMAIPKITDENRDNCWVFAQLLGELISNGNTDGLGYAAFDKAGNIFGEKWLVNGTAFKDLMSLNKMTADKMQKIYSFFGDRVLKHEAQAIVLHTRAATCEKGIHNVHPFIDNVDTPTVAIIHNGMIYNDEMFTRKYSTCDSEVIAHLYAEHKAHESVAKISGFTEKMRGWYTVLALSKDATGKMVMDAFSDTGRLGSYFIKELDTRVYSTWGSDVLKIANGLGMTAVDEQTIEAGTAFRIDVLTGEQIETAKIETAYNVPVTVYPNEVYWGPNIITAKGNLDDDEFAARFFAGFRA